MAKQEVEQTPAEPTMASVLALLAKIQGETLAVQQQQLKQTVKEIRLNPGLTPFNPQGDKDFPMPELICHEFWAPHKMSSAALGGLTREEVELINLLRPGLYTIRMIDNAPQIIQVVGVLNSVTQQPEKMSLMGPNGQDGKPTGLFTKESRHRFPSMANYLRQMINGIDEDGTIQPGPADAVLTMSEIRRRIKLPVDDPKHLPMSVGEY